MPRTCSVVIDWSAAGSYDIETGFLDAKMAEIIVQKEKFRVLHMMTPHVMGFEIAAYCFLGEWTTAT